jgi:hypothetical protein
MMEFGSSSMEFGPNSGSTFCATPNTGIRVRIPEFLIPGPIPYIQTRCYGNSSNNTRAVPSELEVMLKDFIGKQTAFNKSVEEKLGKIDILASKVDSLALDIKLLKLKVFPNEVKENNTFTTANAIQVRIDENVRMLAELHAR